ncbi:MAG: flippase-like domain-containing protein [Actinomycetota bacterium]|nr:flippase-like domain-containing protein [Actinomycetota bacterium]
MDKLKRNFVLALGLGVAVYLVLSILSGFDDLRAALANFRWSLIPVILGLVFVSYVGRYFRWIYYLKALDVYVPPKVNAAIFTAGLSMTISPGKLGEVLKSLFIRQVNGTPVARTAPIVLAERVTDGTGMIVWGLLGALAFSRGPGLMFLFLAVTVVGVVVLRSKWLSLLAERVLERLPLVNRLSGHLGAFHGASDEVLSTRSLVVTTLISFVTWGFEILAVYLCAIGIGVDIPFLMLVFIFAVSSILGSMSMLPGGIGAAEAGLAGQFVTIAGLSSGVAVALTMVIRFATLWFAILLGVTGLFAVRLILGDVEPEPEAPASPAEK